MLITLRKSLPLFAALAMLAVTATSEAAWPRYRVSSAYSLPSAPAMRPMFVPVYPTDRYLQANPGVVPANYAAPNVTVPGLGAPAANYPPSLLAPPNISVPNTSFYPQQPYAAQQYNQPQYSSGYAPYNYNTPTYNAPAYNPPSTSYYNPPAHQQPQPIQPYTQQPVQPYGGFYQPTRPSTFYSPTPSYYPQQPVFGQY